MNKRKYICDDCAYEWKESSGKTNPDSCPICNSFKIYSSVRHKRFAKRSREKMRWSYRS